MSHTSNRNKLQRVQSLDIDHSDLKMILKQNFDFLVRAIDGCICPAEGCPLPKETHRMFKQALLIGQETTQDDQERFISRDSRHLSVDGSTINDHIDIISEETDHGSVSKSPSTDSGVSVGEDMNYYVQNGYLLLINNIWFKKRNIPRNKAEEEGQRIKNLFSKFGFTVEYHINQTKSSMRDTLRKLAKPDVNTIGLNGYDCFVCFIMSHGSSKGVHGTDDEPYELDEIIKNFKGNNCSALIGKPKIFLFQSCRGNGNDRGVYLPRGNSDVVIDGDNRTRFTIPSDSDILMVCSTSEGMVSKREFMTVDGKKTFVSWFVQAIEEILSQYAHKEDILKMLTRVNQFVALTGDGNTGVQMPCQFSTLTKSVYLTSKS